MKLKNIVMFSCVLSLVAHSAAAVPIVYEGTIGAAEVFGINTQPLGDYDIPVGADYWRFDAEVGQRIEIFGKRQAGHYDMAFWVFQGLFSNTDEFGPFFDFAHAGFIAYRDDDLPPNMAGPFGDPVVRFSATVAGPYTLAVTNGFSDDNPPNPYSLVATTPEPASLVLMGSGLAVLVHLGRRKRRAGR